ncbi:GerW family sporulation protein [Streptomyces bambusae]|uniref:Sporulation protein n=1 Tax=Streptomyces bambusae TaxID=1550616 RepID=A0ABS6YZB7_9ACTN|nr:spore germination protein GerW family protein [Streptomyces bambusae]MBW5480348.1 sporulation protein [Streptomyces bambusae]
MTAPDDQTQPAPAAESTIARASADLLEHLADKLGARASVRAVYGEPVTSGAVTVIPVAEIAYGFGGGAGRDSTAAKHGEGGGGGGGAAARPRGFIVIKDGTAVYKPVRDPWMSIVVPLAAFVTGMAAARLARRWAQRA